MVEYHKLQWIWWDLAKAKNRPKNLHKNIVQLAGEIMDIEEGHAAIAIMNEERDMETYLVPLDQIRPRGGG